MIETVSEKTNLESDDKPAPTPESTMAPAAGQAGDPANDAAAATADVAPEAGAETAPDPRDAEIAELKDKLLRAVAEAENVRRRAARDKEDAHKFAVANFARDLCEVADNLRRAVVSVPAEHSGDEAVKGLLEGVEMTERALLGAFERHGLRQIDPAGEKFDPNLHEAMTEIEAPDAEPGTVVQVFQTGYVLNDRLLRPARVVVARGGQKRQGGAVDTVA